MAGINQGTPEVAVGEPVRLGDNGEYELEHDPVTDRLIVRDTVNDKEAYVRPETNGQIGNQGAFIRSLVNGEPLADDGRTYSTPQEAERNANGWIFVPPGTYGGGGDFVINTDGLTVKGAGYGSHLTHDTSNGHAVFVAAENVTIQNLSVSTPTGTGNGDADGIRVAEPASNCTIQNVTVRNVQQRCIHTYAPDTSVIGVTVETSNGDRGTGVLSNDVRTTVTDCIFNDVGYIGVRAKADDAIITNNVIINSYNHGIMIDGANDSVVGGNRITGSGSGETKDGIRVDSGSDCIIFNNRVSDSSGSDLNDFASGTLLDSNLTGASN